MSGYTQGGSDVSDDRRDTDARTQRRPLMFNTLETESTDTQSTPTARL
jgi:hypothetical protein